SLRDISSHFISRMCRPTGAHHCLGRLKKQDVVWSSLSKTRLPKQRLYPLSRRLHQLRNEALCRPYGSRHLGKITSGVTAEGCANKTRKIVSYRKWICRKQSNQPDRPLLRLALSFFCAVGFSASCRVSDRGAYLRLVT